MPNTNGNLQVDALVLDALVVAGLLDREHWTDPDRLGQALSQALSQWAMQVLNGHYHRLMQADAFAQGCGEQLAP